MTTKEKVKKEIDALPDDLLDQVYKFINTIKAGKVKGGRLHTFKLNGKFDNLNIREQSYE